MEIGFLISLFNFACFLHIIFGYGNGSVKKSEKATIDFTTPYLRNAGLDIQFNHCKTTVGNIQDRVKNEILGLAVLRAENRFDTDTGKSPVLDLNAINF